jgi:hypothetical protein
MPVFPQHSAAKLVEYANFVSALDASYSANPGDFVEFEPSANRVLTLPPAASGGPVGVQLGGTFGAGFTVQVVRAAGDTGVIKGLATGNATSVTLRNSGDNVVLTSDGTNWYAVSKAHNSADTF